MSGFSNLSHTTKGFGISNDAANINFSHNNPILTGRILPASIGNTGAAIPASALYSRAFVVSPSAASQAYVLPSATALFSEYGFNITTGQANLAPTNVIPFTVINQSLFPAYIASSPTGGDGTGVIAYGSGSTGTGGPAQTGTIFTAHATQFYLGVTAVNASTAGVTGSYTIFV